MWSLSLSKYLIVLLPFHLRMHLTSPLWSIPMAIIAALVLWDDYEEKLRLLEYNHYHCNTSGADLMTAIATK